MVEPVPQHPHVVEPAHWWRHVPVGRAVPKFDAAGVGVGEHVVGDHHAVDGILAAHGLEADALVNVLEDAVGHCDVRAAATVFMICA